jgi:hypothetical protein
MKLYSELKKYSDADFKRLVGVRKATFVSMLEFLEKEEQKQKALWGKPNILAMAERLLMALEYMREYRTYFHIAQSYGVNESTCWRNCMWIEKTLLKNPNFHVPWKKALLEQNQNIKTIIVDATEEPIERPKRPKKNEKGGVKENPKDTTIRERKKPIR